MPRSDKGVVLLAEAFGDQFDRRLSRIGTGRYGAHHRAFETGIVGYDGVGTRAVDGAMSGQRKRQVVGARLVTDGFIGRFDELAEQADSVWLASAWITRSKALDRLLTRGRGVRTMAGIHGNATDPDAIQSLIDSGCGVRIVEGGALFHPKLYLFRRLRGRTLGWIGSANFTGAGLAGNREVILEFDDEGAISEMESWFDAQWCSLKGQDVEAVLHDYRGARNRDGVAPLSSIVDYRGTRDRDGVAPHPSSIVDGVPRPARHGRHEQAKYVYSFFGVKCGARSYPRIVQEVLAAFHDLDEGFLERFAQWDEQKVQEPKGGSGHRRLKRYVAKTVAELQLSEGAVDLPLPDGWKLANKFEDYHHFRGLGENTGMLRKACELVRLRGGVAYKGHVYQQGGFRAERPPTSVAVIGSTRQRRTYWP